MIGYCSKQARFVWASCGRNRLPFTRCRPPGIPSPDSLRSGECRSKGRSERSHARVDRRSTHHDAISPARSRPRRQLQPRVRAGVTEPSRRSRRLQRASLRGFPRRGGADVAPDPARHRSGADRTARAGPGGDHRSGRPFGPRPHRGHALQRGPPAPPPTPRSSQHTRPVAGPDAFTDHPDVDFRRRCTCSGDLFV